MLTDGWKTAPAVGIAIIRNIKFDTKKVASNELFKSL